MLEIKNKIEFGNNLWVGLISSSTFNSSKEDRIKAVTDISSITLGRLGQIYKDEDINNLQEYTGCIGKRRLNLYNKLLKESNNRPSTPFEFIPVKIEYVLLTKLIRIANNIHDLSRLTLFIINKIFKYSYLVESNGLFILTNLRCLLNANIKEEDIPFNTPEEIEGFKVVIGKIPKTTFDHLVVHRELGRIAESSRNKKYLNEVEFYYPEYYPNSYKFFRCRKDFEYLEELKGNINMYDWLKAEDATKELSCRRLMLCAFHGWLQNENSWQNLFNLRINPKAQSITQQVVTNIKQVIK